LSQALADQQADFDKISADIAMLAVLAERAKKKRRFAKEFGSLCVCDPACEATTPRASVSAYLK
jgi:hypothetical protein